MTRQPCRTDQQAPCRRRRHLALTPSSAAIWPCRQEGRKEGRKVSFFLPSLSPLSPLCPRPVPGTRRPTESPETQHSCGFAAGCPRCPRCPRSNHTPPRFSGSLALLGAMPATRCAKGTPHRRPPAAVTLRATQGQALQGMCNTPCPAARRGREGPAASRQLHQRQPASRGRCPGAPQAASALTVRPCLNGITLPDWRTASR